MFRAHLPTIQVLRVIRFKKKKNIVSVESASINQFLPTFPAAVSDKTTKALGQNAIYIVYLIHEDLSLKRTRKTSALSFRL